MGEDDPFKGVKSWEREPLTLERLRLARARLDEAEMAAEEAMAHLIAVVRNAVRAGIDGSDIAPVIRMSPPWVSKMAKGLKPKKAKR